MIVSGIRFSYNPYFLLPCMAWWLTGGLLLYMNSDISLFLYVNGGHSLFGDLVMPFVTMMGQVEVIIPVLALLFAWKRFRTKAYFISALACNVIPFLVQQSMKSLFDRDRPLAFFLNDPGRVHILPDWPQLFHRSFPSGHSAGAFSFFCFLSLLLPPGYRKWGAILSCLAMLVGYSRVYLAAHFVGDVWFGSMAGTLTTLIVFYWLHKKGWTPGAEPRVTTNSN